jgi:biotin carboxyl carrier protein
MKMEIAVTATVAGKVIKVLCTEGMSVSAGQNLIVIEEE